MAMKSVVYEANLVADTHRGPSQSIWADCDVPLLIEQANEGAGGMYTWDDFDVGALNVASNIGTFGRWAAYASTGAFVIDAQIEGGGITIGDATDNEGVTIGGGIGSYRITTTSTLALNQQLWFETRVARSTISASTGNVFVGLCSGFLDASTGAPTAGIPITTGDALVDKDLIGFWSTAAAPTEWSFAYKLTGQAAVQPTGLTTLMNTVRGSVLTAGGYVKLGFRFDPNAAPVLITSASTGQTVGTLARPLIKVYVDGIAAAAFLTSVNVQGTAFPTKFMAPIMQTMNSTGAVNGTFDWIRCAQLPNS